MIDTPQIVETGQVRTAIIKLTCPRNEIQNVMGPAIGELMQTVAAQGVGPTGTWYSHHRRVTPDIFDFEIGVPVSAPVKDAGRVTNGILPAARVARFVHTGSYEGLGAAWGEFNEWVETQGYQAAPNLWERYLSGPDSSPDPATWRTELNRPLLD
jgi:effector-binding domain-containing protein